MEVIKAQELAADEHARAQTSEPSRLRPGNHVALRVTKEESHAESKFSPFFKGPYVIVNVKRAGVTADIRCLATGSIATVNRCHLNFGGDPPTCTSFKTPTAGRIPLGTSFLDTRGGEEGGQMQTCRLGRPCMRPVGCAQTRYGSGAVSRARYLK